MSGTKTGRRWKRRGLCLVAAWITACGVLAQSLDDLERLKQNFEKGLAEIEAGEESRVSLLGKYLNGLKALYDKLREASEDLDGILLIRDEIQRLQAEKHFGPEHVTDKHEQVAALQKRFLALLGDVQSESDKKYLKWSDDYGAALDRLEVSLVKLDKIDDAVAVRTEKNRVLQGERYLAAKERIEGPTEPSGGPEIVAEEGESETNTVSRIPTPEHLSPSELEKLVGTIRKSPLVYRSRADAPRVDSKREVLHFTSHKSRAVAAIMIGNVYLQTIKTRIKIPGSEYNYWNDLEHQIPRLEVKAGPKPLSDCTVVYDYYCKSGSSRWKVKTERIRIGELDTNQEMVVDPAGYSAIKRSYMGYSSPSERYFGNKETGNYAGYIVSVFDADGSLCFQRTSLASLAEHARNSPGAK